MKEYIERAGALDAARRAFSGQECNCEVMPDVFKALQEVPTAAVAEVRHGRWIPEIHHTYLPVEYDENGFPILHEYTSFRCSLCGRGEPIEEPYCHCGARMDKEAEHD